MACPTCDHTMECITPGVVWWCPRCGTVHAPTGFYIPKLVERARDFANRLAEAVVTDGEDSGVILMSNDAPTKYDDTLGCSVYLHDHFSPLGDHLVRLHRDMIETVGLHNDQA